MKKINRMNVLFFMCIFFIFFGKINAQAESLSHKNNVFVSGESSEYRNYKFLKIHMPKSGVCGFSFKIKFIKEVDPVIQQSLGISLYKVLYEDGSYTKQKFSSMKIDSMDDFELIDTELVEDIMSSTVYNKKQGFVYEPATDRIPTQYLEAGDYIVEFFNGTGYDWKISYDVSWYSGIAQKLKLPSNISFTAGKSYTLKINPMPSKTLARVAYAQITNLKEGFFIICHMKDSDHMVISADKPGKYKLIVYLENGRKCTCTVNVKANKSSKPKIKYSSYKLYAGEEFVNYILYNSKKVTWSSSNKNIATVNKNGKIVAKQAGECKITATIGKNKYVCDVKVLRQQPDFFACLSGYDRNRNYFTVRIKNNGKKDLIVCSSGAKAIDDMYPSFDRKLKFAKKKDIIIKPGKSKTLKYYVDGSRTWYDYRDFVISYNINYDGKKYSCLTGDCMSEYRDKEKETYLVPSESYYYWVDPIAIQNNTAFS